MKIAVISDTHIPERADRLPQDLLDAIQGVDLIVHAGDVITPDVLEELKKIAPLKAVQGNMDRPEVRKVLPVKEVFEAGGFKIGLTHGFGPPRYVMENVYDSFNNEKLDVIILGHSHQPVCEKRNGILFINPGSPTDTIFASHRTFAMLEITDTIQARIITLA